jgi:mono/diheme cytochrome c family protein
MTKPSLLSLVCAAALLAVLGTPAATQQQDPAIRRGQTLLLTNCARCHEIGRYGESPLRIAPPFRKLHKRYAIETLEEALAEGIRTGHPTMPEFSFDADQVNDIIAYLKTLER